MKAGPGRIGALVPVAPRLEVRNTLEFNCVLCHSDSDFGNRPGAAVVDGWRKGGCGLKVY